jgi:hypothetical protein
MIKNFQTMNGAFNQNSDSDTEFDSHILHSTSVRDLVSAWGTGIEGLSDFEKAFLASKRRFTPVTRNVKLTRLK